MKVQDRYITQPNTWLEGNKFINPMKLGIQGIVQGDVLSALSRYERQACTFPRLVPILSGVGRIGRPASCEMMLQDDIRFQPTN